MDDELKSILLEIVHDLADLRTNQGLLAVRVGTGVTIADARDAKKSAKPLQIAGYEELIQRINALRLAYP